MRQAASDFGGTAHVNSDWHDWLGQVSALLPSGKASVNVNGGLVV